MIRSILIFTCAFISSLALARPSGAQAPNIILVNLDDADWGLFSDHIMPRFQNIRRLATEGMTFTNLHVTTPFCGPSRACLVRGQYAHRTGIKVNDPTDPNAMGFSGGYDVFLEKGFDRNEMGYWMRNAGYRTMFVGKYHHHGYVGPEIPPGWDEFYSSFGAHYTSTFMLTTRDNPNGRYEQRGPAEYRTNVEGDDIRNLIIRHRNDPATRARPFFLYYAPFAPHRPTLAAPFESMVEPRFENWVPNLRMPITPDFNEENVQDKPLHVRQRPLSEFFYTAFQDEFRLRARSIKSVDLLMGKLMNTLEQQDLDDNTYIIFTSDNGFQLGHHRMTNKLDPYNRSTNVPMFVWGPDVPAGVKANHLLAHIDICPTILNLARRSIPSVVEGKSFKPLLENPGLYAPDRWREPVIIENWALKPNLGQRINCTYSALRLYSEIYIEWAEGANEYYDFETDPFQLQNSYNSLSFSKQRALADQLHSIRNETMDPITTMTLPIQGRALRDQIRMEGAAEDDRMVRGVNVVIRSTNTGRYYDGEKWVDGWVRIPANVTANDRQMCYWNKEVSVSPETESGMDFLQVMSYAFGSTGDFSKPFTIKHIPLDQVQPTSEITYPEFSLNVPPGSQTISGTASDNYRLENVRLVIKNQTETRYWNGSAWTESWAYVLADLDKSTGQWSYTFNAAPDRNYWFSSRAMDQAGNAQGSFDSSNLTTF